MSKFQYLEVRWLKEVPIAGREKLIFLNKEFRDLLLVGDLEIERIDTTEIMVSFRQETLLLRITLNSNVQQLFIETFKEGLPITSNALKFGNYNFGDLIYKIKEITLTEREQVALDYILQEYGLNPKETRIYLPYEHLYVYVDDWCEGMIFRED